MIARRLAIAAVLLAFVSGTAAAAGTRLSLAPLRPPAVGAGQSVRAPARLSVKPMQTRRRIIAAFPDVTKTPAPGGPVPIPYPNLRTAR